jgi:hypothetical protein
MGIGGLRHATAALPPGKNPVPIAKEVGWASGLVLTGAENLTSHRDSIPGPSQPEYALVAHILISTISSYFHYEL